MCRAAPTRDRVTVHFIGQLQSNKAASVARYADVVQSIDRAKLVRALDHSARQAGRPLEVTVQVNLDQAQGRGGVAPGEARQLADLVARLAVTDPAWRDGRGTARR